MGIVLYVVFILTIDIFQGTDNAIGNLCNRFNTGLPLLFMSVAIGLQIPIYSWATYLRCHLKEPFLINSVVMGCLSCLSAFILGNQWGAMGLASGYLGIQLINVIWSYLIYKNKKNEWHKTFYNNSNIQST